MTIYVIRMWNDEWELEGHAFVREDKAMEYIKDDHDLRYDKVELDVCCGR